MFGVKYLNHERIICLFFEKSFFVKFSFFLIPGLSQNLNLLFEQKNELRNWQK